jgi:hypothetical protein
MAIPADCTIYMSATAARIAAKAYKITVEDGLYGIMTVAYVIVTHPAIVVPLVVRIERVLRVVYPGWGFGRMRQEVMTIFLSFGTAGLIRRGH